MAAVAFALGFGCGGADDGAKPTCVPLEPAAGAAAATAARGVAAPYPRFDRRAETPSAFVTRIVAASGAPFDWSRADDALLCAAIGEGARPLVVGVEGAGTAARRRTLDELIAELRDVPGAPRAAVERDDRLGTIRLALGSCDAIGAIRALPRVAFVEVAAALDAPSAEAELGASSTAPAAPTPLALPALNPGLYDSSDPGYASYADFVEQIDADPAAWIRAQHMDRVFDELGLFGGPAVGVAVLDNGVLPEWVDYLSTGRGTYSTAGYHPPDVGETHPQDGDFFGLAKIIPNTFDHGTRQSRYIQCFAPQANRATVRAASLPYLLLPDDLTGATQALLALADDDTVQVISMSMGTIFRSQEMERAIDEVHRRGKVLVAAAGTSIPVIRDLIGVVFPATLPTVISATGLADTAATGGRFELGSASHGGPENDFAVEPSPASSEAVSSLAGIITTLWSIDPRQPRESIVDALVRSSNFYQANGAKDPVLGWGRVDAYQAALTIRQGGCEVGLR